MAAATADQVEIVLPDEVPALKDGKVSLPIRFDPAASLINSLVFSIDFDESWLAFNDADADLDGVPDAVAFTLPDGFVGALSYDPTDVDGELDIAVYNLLGSGTLPAGTFMVLTMETGSPAGDYLAVVQSSNDPVESFGSITGQSIWGVVQDGSVSLLDFVKTFLPFMKK